MSISRSLTMFGVEDMKAFEAMIKSTMTYLDSGMSAVASSLLSDVQEQMAMGDTESARQTINRVKYLLSLKD